MKTKLLLTMGLLLLSFCNICLSQIIVDTKAKIANVDFNMINNELVINYDLINSKSSEKFLITVNILNDAGKLINSKTFKGDIGENISGGMNKRIIWIISDDIAFLDDKISVEVIATHQNPRIIQPTGTGKAFLLSTLFPGLGSSKTTLRNVHLLKGVAAYGSIAGSFYYKGKSDKSYSDYLEAGSTADRDKLYDQAVKEVNTSKILLYTAGAIWLIDYATILLSENRSQKKGLKSQIVYLGPSLDAVNSFRGMSMVVNF